MTKQNITNFGFKEISAVKGKQHSFYDLSINGVFQLEAFEAELEANYKSELRTIITYMDYCSNGGTLPHTKMKDITPHGETIKEYEFKSKHIRVYGIQQPGGKLIIFCGYKNSQPSDIVRFRSLKRKFMETPKEHIHGKK
ncbi:hypothetical protein [Chitinophaga sp.]|uniref:hypothetical protein n=1 Tax=Chitinophaga sp. TaxID=1869181 RepID=UPI0031E07272